MWKLIVILGIFSLVHSCRVIEEKANGIATNRGEFSSHVLLEVFINFEWKLWCSGVLISDRYVLTSANCVFGMSFVNVHVYANSLRDVFEDEREIYKSTVIKLKPEYDASTYMNDIALIELPVTLKVDEKKYTIAKLPPIDALVVQEGIDGVNVGWGLLNYLDDNASKYKQAQHIATISGTDCRLAYPKWSDDSQYQGRFCTQRSNKQPNCVSDNGSPWMIGDVVHGIQSLQQTHTCLNNAPNLMQEVRFHGVWISQEAGLI